MIENVTNVNKPKWNYPPVFSPDLQIHMMEGQNQLEDVIKTQSYSSKKAKAYPMSACIGTVYSSWHLTKVQWTPGWRPLRSIRQPR